jgi:hypothetical protein
MTAARGEQLPVVESVRHGRLDAQGGRERVPAVPVVDLHDAGR